MPRPLSASAASARASERLVLTGGETGLKSAKMIQMAQPGESGQRQITQEGLVDGPGFSSLLLSGFNGLGRLPGKVEIRFATIRSISSRAVWRRLRPRAESAQVPTTRTRSTQIPRAVETNRGKANQTTSKVKCRTTAGRRPKKRYSPPNISEGMMSSTTRA